MEKRNKKGDRPWTPNARNDFMPKSANGFTANLMEDGICLIEMKKEICFG
ncbi:hypothetical protein PO124_10670 [Bacillus licheniformis]|nr:hypothetical protein [Bacillus licheniformis]